MQPNRIQVTHHSIAMRMLHPSLPSIFVCVTVYFFVLSSVAFHVSRVYEYDENDATFHHTTLLSDQGWTAFIIDPSYLQVKILMADCVELCNKVTTWVLHSQK